VRGRRRSSPRVPSAAIASGRPAIVAAVHRNLRGFRRQSQTPVILDEIQNAPELLNYIQPNRLKRSRKGPVAADGITGLCLEARSLPNDAGRAAVLHLVTALDCRNSQGDTFARGYPEFWRDHGLRSLFQSYLQTYLERDVRQVSQIPRTLATFRRFLSLIASRTGQILSTKPI